MKRSGRLGSDLLQRTPVRGLLRDSCLVAVLLLAVPGAHGTEMFHGNSQSEDASTNVWGGEHVEMNITAEGATLDFDCAEGTIRQAIHLPPAGRITLTGTYTRELPGPTRNDGNRTAPASYVATIKDGSMHLEVRLTQSNEVIGTYDLVRGQAGHVMKCR